MLNFVCQKTSRVNNFIDPCSWKETTINPATNNQNWWDFMAFKQVLVLNLGLSSAWKLELEAWAWFWALNLGVSLTVPGRGLACVGIWCFPWAGFQTPNSFLGFFWAYLRKSVCKFSVAHWFFRNSWRKQKTAWSWLNNIGAAAPGGVHARPQRAQENNKVRQEGEKW